MLKFPNGIYKWQIDDIMEMLEEHPEYKSMSDEELKKKIQELYWEASGLFDQANRLESNADTIERYIKIRKKSD